jgi:hypothetical protein
MPVGAGGPGLGGLPALGALGQAFSGAGQSMSQMLPQYMQYKYMTETQPMLERYQAYQQRGIYFKSPQDMLKAEQDQGTPAGPSVMGPSARAIPGEEGHTPGAMGIPGMPARPSALDAITEAQREQAAKGGIQYDPQTGMPRAEIPGPVAAGGATVYPYFPPTQIPTMLGRGAISSQIGAGASERNTDVRTAGGVEEAHIRADATVEAARIRAATEIQRIQSVYGRESQAALAAYMRSPDFLLKALSDNPTDQEYVNTFRDAMSQAATNVGGGGGVGGPHQGGAGGARRPAGGGTQNPADLWESLHTQHPDWSAEQVTQAVHAQLGNR